MAALLFHLLFFGRHPYAGIPLDPKLPGDLEGAIRGDRFAYGARRAALGVEQPPGTLPLGIYGDGVAALFERAFAPGSPARPDEKDWLEQLQALQSNLTTCKASPTHHYPSHLTRCPWCDLEARQAPGCSGRRSQPGALARSRWRSCGAPST